MRLKYEERQVLELDESREKTVLMEYNIKKKTQKRKTSKSSVNHNKEKQRVKKICLRNKTKKNTLPLN